MQEACHERDPIGRDSLSNEDTPLQSRTLLALRAAQLTRMRSSAELVVIDQDREAVVLRRDIGLPSMSEGRFRELDSQKAGVYRNTCGIRLTRHLSIATILPTRLQAAWRRTGAPNHSQSRCPDDTPFHPVCA
jgi:hypothetical protein